MLGGNKMTKEFRKVVRRKSHKENQALYAVFDRETKTFMGVGGFTRDEINSLDQDYMFSRI